MQIIDYFKYASNGNNFVLIDEILNEIIPECVKSKVADYIENNVSGIGCDSVIYLQKFDEKTLNQVYQDNNVISMIKGQTPEYIIRIFEKGIESNMCGNGLICASFHLGSKHGVQHAKIATEIPSQSPVVRPVIYYGNGTSNAVLGKAVLPPDSFVNYSAIDATKEDQHCTFSNLSLTIKINGMSSNCITCVAHMTFTGEPHLVFFKQHNNGLFNTIFENVESDYKLNIIDNLIDQIGSQINAFNYFPKGINVNFSNVLSNNSIENRCFERGINAETYACGTGAVAVAFLANKLKLISSNNICVLPLKARQHILYKDGTIQISKSSDNYSITAHSILLSQGEYYYSSSQQ